MLQLSSLLDENLEALNARFGASADFYAKRIELYHCPGAIVLFDNMASLEALWAPWILPCCRVCSLNEEEKSLNEE